MHKIKIKLFCETFNSSEYFQVVRENTNISSDLVRTRQKQLENFLTSAENATLVPVSQFSFVSPYSFKNRAESS